MRRKIIEAEHDNIIESVSEMAAGKKQIKNCNFFVTGNTNEQLMIVSKRSKTFSFIRVALELYGQSRYWNAKMATYLCPKMRLECYLAMLQKENRQA